MLVKGCSKPFYYANALSAPDSLWQHTGIILNRAKTKVHTTLLSEGLWNESLTG